MEPGIEFVAPMALAILSLILAAIVCALSASAKRVVPITERTCVGGFCKRVKLEPWQMMCDHCVVKTYGEPKVGWIKRLREGRL